MEGNMQKSEQSDLSSDLLIAVPKKGRVYQKVVKLLEETGLEYSRSNRLDFAKCKRFPNTTILFLPCKDIPNYLARGNVDIGITGQDMIAECNADVKSELQLGFGACRVCVLGPVGKFKSIKQLEGCTIGTSFPGITKQYFQTRGIKVEIQLISGSVEIACPLGLADAVVDLVETGTTMRAAGLEVVEKIMETEMVVASNYHSKHKEAIQKIVKRFEGFTIARDWLLISYNLQTHLIPEAVKITPGMDSPSIVSLAKEGWVALSAMVKRKGYASVIDTLTTLGARGVFVTELKHYRAGSMSRSSVTMEPQLQPNSTFKACTVSRNVTADVAQYHPDASERSNSTSIDSADQAKSFASGTRHNVGNVITQRPSTRVQAPPGGKSSLLFG